VDRVADGFDAVDQVEDVWAELEVWRAGRSPSSGSLVTPPAAGLSCGAYLAAGLVRSSGRVIEQRIRFGVGTPPPGGRRGEIVPWTRPSRRHLRLTMNRVIWERHSAAWVVVTLTLPGSDVAVCMDGVQVKRWLRSWLKRWHRRFGWCPYAWKLEFQGRGAAHFAVVLPITSAHAMPSNLAQLRRWVARAWWEVVGSGAATHLQAGTQTSLIRHVSALSSYMVGEFVKGRKSKEYQHVVPGDYRKVGRWWYVSPQLCEPWSEWAQDERTAYRTRRVLTRLVRSPGYARAAVRARRRRVGRVVVFLRGADALGMGWRLQGLRA
jgi:hypothetical protein